MNNQSTTQIPNVQERLLKYQDTKFLGITDEVAKAAVMNATREELIQQNSWGGTVLHMLDSVQDKELFNNVVNKLQPQDFMLTTTSGQTALHRFVERNHDSEAIKILIDHTPAEGLALQDSGGDTALHRMASYNNIDVVNTLVSKMSKDSLGITNKDGNTALHCAAEVAGKESMLKLLKAMSPAQILIQNNNNDSFIATYADFDTSAVIENIEETLNGIKGIIIAANPFGKPQLIEATAHRIHGVAVDDSKVHLSLNDLLEDVVSRDTPPDMDGGDGHDRLEGDYDHHIEDDGYLG